MRRHDNVFACSLVAFLGVLVACGTSSEGTNDDGADAGPSGDDTPGTVAEGGANGDDDDTITPGGDAGSDAAASGTPCKEAIDCPSKVCDPVNLICLPPGPKDGVQNADETDVDCGGAVADRCDVDKACKVNADCKDAGACKDLKCQLPGPGDGLKNNGETSIDCGGPSAPACPNVGDDCLVKADCVTQVCVANKCAEPAVGDGAHNGTETDVDCGGPTAPPCADNLMCNGPTDCTSLSCADKGGGLRCQPPSDTDGIKNGTETDLDCGGGNKGCAAGLTCNNGGDCASLGCNFEGKCAAGRSCTGHYGGDTCGLGGAGGRGAAEWEDCCATADVSVTLSSATATEKAGVTRLDKYQVTAGRMRTFLESVNYDVRGFVQQARAEGKIPNVFTGNAVNQTKSLMEPDWDPYLPTSFNGNNSAAEIADCDQGTWDNTYQVCCLTVPPTTGTTCPAGSTYTAAHTGDERCHYWDNVAKVCNGGNTGIYNGTYTSVRRHLGGTIFRGNDQDATGCFPGSPGTHAFRFSETPGDPTYVANADNAEHSQSVYDTKAMNCTNYLMAQAFCIWDGGRLASLNEWRTASYGTGGTTLALGSHTQPYGATYPITGEDQNPGTDAVNPPWWFEVQLDPKKQVSGTYSGRRFPNTTDVALRAAAPVCPPSTPNCAVNTPLYPDEGHTIEYANWRYSYEYPNLTGAQKDFIVFISAPGRTKGRGWKGHADLIGNVFEIQSTVTYYDSALACTANAQCPNNSCNVAAGHCNPPALTGPTGGPGSTPRADGLIEPSVWQTRATWSGNGSWEVHDYGSGGGANSLLNKYGKQGFRCAHK